MTILFTCVWGGLLDSEEIEYRNINQVFFWNSSFLYNNTDVKDLNNEFSLEITYVDSAMVLFHQEEFINSKGM